MTDLHQQDVHALLAMLVAQYGQRLMISVREAGPAIGMTGRTAQNRASLGTFPLPVVTDGGRARVRLIDVARYLAGEPAKMRPRRGRPTKAEQIARRRAGGEA